MGFRIVISGSFRKHYEPIRKLINEFQELGCQVLSPKESRIVNPGADFIFLETDQERDPRKVEERHLFAIAKADCLFICNPEGYMGQSATLEMGYALGQHKPVFVLEEMPDTVVNLFVRRATPKEVVDIIRNEIGFF